MVVKPETDSNIASATVMGTPSDRIVPENKNGKPPNSPAKIQPSPTIAKASFRKMPCGIFRPAKNKPPPKIRLQAIEAIKPQKP